MMGNLDVPLQQRLVMFGLRWDLEREAEPPFGAKLVATREAKVLQVAQVRRSGVFWVVEMDKRRGCGERRVWT